MLEEASAFAELVCVINIAPALPQFDAHSPGLAKSVVLFNETLSKITSGAGSNVRLVDVNSALSTSADVLDACISKADGHHLTIAGHRLYADMLAATAGQLLTVKASPQDMALGG